MNFVSRTLISGKSSSDILKSTKCCISSSFQSKTTGPGISKEEYHERRQKLFKLCVKDFENDKKAKNHVLVFPSAPKQYYSPGIAYPFRQNTEFNYLCGLDNRDNCVLILVNGSSDDEVDSILFIPQQLEDHKVWEGTLPGLDYYIESLGVSEAKYSKEISPFFSSYFKSKNDFVLWYDYDNKANEQFNKEFMESVIKYGNQSKIENPNKNIQSLRVIKSEAEVALMKRSMEITANAFNIAGDFFLGPSLTDKLLGDQWREVIGNPYEFQIQAALEYGCQKEGGKLAYIPVVAGGERANIIHYIQNDQQLKPEEMVLVDAGCEYKGYTTDITRVLNFKGQSTNEQRTLKKVVAQIQKECIALCTSEYTLNEIHQEMMQKICDHLVDLNFMPPNESNEFYTQRTKKFCPHAVGHYLGMDLHDTPLISRNEKLRPGMIVTIEPGIYMRPELVPSDLQKFQNIGVRIEDDILVTDKKPVVLSEGIPQDLS